MSSILMDATIEEFHAAAHDCEKVRIQDESIGTFPLIVPGYYVCELFRYQSETLSSQ